MQYLQSVEARSDVNIYTDYDRCIILSKALVHSITS